jgi:hypothetical protein
MMSKPLTELQGAVLQEKVQSDVIAAEFPTMTEAERKAQLKAELSEKLRIARVERAFEKMQRRGYIYVIGSECGKYPYKIGLSKSPPARRLNDLQTSHWANLKVYYESPQISYIELVEKALHDKFRKKHVRGEWFNLTKRDITYIAKNILVVAAEVAAKLQEREQKRKENLRTRCGLSNEYREREMFNLKNDDEYYLFSRNLPPYLMEKNCPKYISPIGLGSLRKVVTKAIERSNAAYKKKNPRLDYMNYTWYKHVRSDYL